MFSVETWGYVVFWFGFALFVGVKIYGSEIQLPSYTLITFVGVTAIQIGRALSRIDQRLSKLEGAVVEPKQGK